MAGPASGASYLSNKADYLEGQPARQAGNSASQKAKSWEEKGALAPASTSVYAPTSKQKRRAEESEYRQYMAYSDIEMRRRRLENHERANSLLPRNRNLEREMDEMFGRNPINNPYDPRTDNRDSRRLADPFTGISQSLSLGPSTGGAAGGAAKRTKFKAKNPYTLELEFSKLTL